MRPESVHEKARTEAAIPPLQGGILFAGLCTVHWRMHEMRPYHRGLYRLAVTYPAMYCVTSTVGEGKVTNLSAMGCAIETDEQLLMNQQMALRLILPDKSDSLPIDTAEVKGVAGTRAGVEFRHLEREAHLRLHSFVWDKMIERLQLLQQQRAASPKL